MPLGFGIALFVEMLDWEIIMIPAGAGHVRPHPGPLPQEMGNHPPTHRQSMMPVVRCNLGEARKGKNQKPPGNY